MYRFVSPEDGTIEFFDPEGRSLRKFLMRKPVAEGRMTSGFGMRRHPILGYARMHTGIDYGRPYGHANLLLRGMDGSSRPDGRAATAAASRSSMPTAM